MQVIISTEPYLFNENNDIVFGIKSSDVYKYSTGYEYFNDGDVVIEDAEMNQSDFYNQNVKYAKLLNNHPNQLLIAELKHKIWDLKDSMYNDIAKQLEGA